MATDYFGLDYEVGPSNYSLLDYGNFTNYGAGIYGNDTGSWNVTGNVTGRDAQTDFPDTWTVHHRASSYAFIITMLSITVIMATMFTLFGLFMKAEAHKSSEDHHGGQSGHGGGHSMFQGGLAGNDDNFMKSIDIDME